MNKKQILIIRHGETEFNRMNMVQGSGVDTSLNDLGQQQSAQFYNTYKDFPFDRVYTSALRRARESVSQFISNGIPHTVCPELNEISWGDYEGKIQTPEQRGFYWETVNLWKSGELNARIPNGESPLELQERQRKVADMIFERADERNILICMHGRAMKSFLCLLLNEPLTNMENFQHANLCLYHLEYDGRICTVVKSNDTTHLMQAEN